VRFLLDSVILIDHFNNIEAATNYLQQNWEEIAISVITKAEVLAGFAPADALIAAQLLDRFPNLEMTVQVADLAATLRRQERWRLPDAIQAAFAQIHGLTLVTRNTRDFPPERYKFVVVPYQLGVN
jgi:predicted nucleic acid-binding protein